MISMLRRLAAIAAMTETRARELEDLGHQ